MAPKDETNQPSSKNNSPQKLKPLRITFIDLTYAVRDKSYKASSHWKDKFGRRNRPAGSILPVIEEGADLEAASNQQQRNMEQKNANDSFRMKTLLKGMTGVFREGRLTAIMGSSGAGKTTLLSVLAGDMLGGMRGAKLSGQVYVDNTLVLGDAEDATIGQQDNLPRKRQSRLKMRDISGFVFQDDLLLETMTVEEAIGMSIRLRTPRGGDAAWRAGQVQDALEHFSLQAARKTRVGNPAKKGISGGERKRTAIAMELVISPPLLFLDEPTSGLDTHTAWQVVSLLRDLTRSGHTVITTIHQPSSNMFRLFDDLLVLAEGRVLYFGPAKQMCSYFACHGYTCPPETNPADFLFMQVIQGIRDTDDGNRDGDGIEGNNKDDKDNIANGGSVLTVAQRQDRLGALLDAWEASPENASLKAMAKDRGPLHPPSGEFEEREFEQTSSAELASSRRYKAPFGRQFWYLLGRASKNAIRNPRIIRVRLVQTVVVAVFVGLSFYDVNRLKPPQQTQNKAGVLFFIALNQFFASAFPIVTIFALEKIVFLREHRAGYYGLPAYYITKVLVEVQDMKRKFN